MTEIDKSIKLLVDKSSRFKDIPEDLKRTIMAMANILIRPGMDGIKYIEKLCQKNNAISSLLCENVEISLRP